MRTSWTERLALSNIAHWNIAWRSNDDDGPETEWRRRSVRNLIRGVGIDEIQKREEGAARRLPPCEPFQKGTVYGRGVLHMLSRAGGKIIPVPEAFF